jgi:phosphocarrier protein HPr
VVEQAVTIALEVGLHARPAAEFVRLAGRFESAVKLTKDGLTVDGKSIMGVMMLAAECGSTVVITVDGPDQDEALASLVSFLETDTEGGRA